MAAEIFEAELARRLQNCHRPVAVRYRQMQRIAKRLREHADEERFDDDVAPLLPDLDSIQLLFTEVVMNEWWGWREHS
jgi:hypothetical protein